MGEGPGAFLAGGRRLATALVDALLPLRCAGCGEIVAARGLCGECWSALTFIEAPYCVRCGLPFAFAVDEAVTCAACLAHPPIFNRARAALAYDDASRPLVLSFKNGDRTESTSVLARLMLRAATPLIETAELMAPVPLHWTRLWRRRYNQAALLTQALGRQSGRRVAVDLLQRSRRTPSQAGLAREARRRNVGGAFQVRASWRAELAGRRVLLVDDVMTTGATVDACARVLLRSGAGAVDVVTLARVARPLPP